MTVESLLRQAEALTPSERRELAARLMEVVMADNPPLSDAMKAELDRRIADSDANPGSGIPWEVVKARAEERARRLEFVSPLIVAESRIEPEVKSGDVQCHSN